MAVPWVNPHMQSSFMSVALGMNDEVKPKQGGTGGEENLCMYLTCHQ